MLVYDGPTFIGYVVTHRCSDTVPFTAGLSRAQRDNREFAAVGATVDEITRHQGKSLETVRSHLKAAYRALGVANRVELATALAEAPTAAPRP